MNFQNRKFLSFLRVAAAALALMLAFSSLCMINAGAVGGASSNSGNTVYFTCPAICADAGDTVDLKTFSVEFTSGKATPAAAINWSSSDIEIKNGKVTPAAGVYILTAEADGKKKTVCLCVRAPGESEYILYSNDFSSGSTDGLRIIEQKNGGKVSVGTDGFLTLDASAATDAYARVLLPEYLDGFGDIKIEAEIKLDKPVNAKRWGSLMLRVQTQKNYPYIQLCLRYDASVENGTEIAERTSADKWNVTQKGPAKIKSSEFNTICADASGSEINYLINGGSQLSKSDVLYPVGGCGFQANGCRLTVNRVKVTVGRVNDVSLSASICNVRDPDSDIVLPPAIITEVNNAQDLTGIITDSPACAILNINSDLDITDAGGKKICPIGDAIAQLDGKVIPVFRPDGVPAAYSLAGYLKQNSLCDAFVISDKEEIIATAKSVWFYIRGIFDFTDRNVGTDADLSALRAECNTADSRVILLSARSATRSNVEYLQRQFVTVWVEAEDNTDAGLVSAIVSGANGIITSDRARLEKCYTEYFDETTLIRSPEVIGHRGVPSLAHENTIAGSLRAFEAGATMVENDIHLSKDGVIMVMHNSTIDATTDGSGAIASMTREQLSKYRVISNKNLTEGEPIPTLEDYFRTFGDKDVKLLVEIKSTDEKLIPELVRLIKQYDYCDRMVVISFSAVQIDRLKEQLPEISVGFLTSKIYPTETLQTSLLSILSDVQSHGTTLNPSYNSGALDPELIRALSYRGVTLWPWTINNITDFTSYFLAGTYGITTNFSQYSSQLAKRVYTDKSSYDLNAGEAPVVSVMKYDRSTSDVTADAKLIVIERTGDLEVSLDPATGKLVHTGYGSASAIFSVECTVNGKSYNLVSELVTLTADAPQQEITTEKPTEENRSGCRSSVGNALIFCAIIGGLGCLHGKKTRKR